MMNKLRGKFEGIKLQWIFLIFGIGAITLVPLRMYQVLTVIEPVTGFYIKNSAVTVIFYIILALVSAALLVLTFLSASLPESKPPKDISVPMLVASVLMVITLLADSIMQAVNVRSIVETMRDNPNATLLSSGALPVILQIIFGLLSAVYFSLVVYSFRFRNTEYKNTYLVYKLWALMPLLWAISRIVYRFMRKISYKNVSDLLLEMFMLVAMMLFFLSVARISSQIENTGMMSRTISCGLICVILCLVCSIPRLVLMVTGNSGMLVENSPLEYCDIAVAIYILSYLFNVLKPGKNSVREISAEVENN